MTQYESKSKGHKQHDPNLELSIGQVLAAAGATVLGAVLAKVFNLWGTIPGTAFLSIFSAIGSVLILRAIRRTGDRVKAQIQAMAPKGPAKGTAVTVRLEPGGATATAKIPDTDQIKALKGEDTVEMEVPDLEPEGRVTDTSSRKQTLTAILVSSFLVFGLTLGTLYLFGALSGDPDRLITTEPDSTTTIIIQSPSADPTSETSESPSPTESPSSSESPSPSPSESASPSESTSETPSESPTTDAGQGGTDETVSPTPESATESTTPG